MELFFLYTGIYLCLAMLLSLLLIGYAIHLGMKASEPSEITWEKWSPEAVQELRNDGQMIYVDGGLLASV